MSAEENNTPTPRDGRGQFFLFDEFDQAWEDEWVGMPEYVHEDLSPMQSVLVHFECRDDIDAFERLVGQTITELTKSLWFPKAEIGHYRDRKYMDE